MRTFCAFIGLSSFTVLTTYAAEPIRNDPGRDPAIGVNIWSVYSQPAGVAAWEQQIVAMKQMGFGAVTILPQSFINLQTGEVTANDPTPNPRFGGMTDAELSATIRKAKSLGMTVTVSPTFEAADRRVFRGHIAFNDPMPGMANMPKPENGVDSAANENRFWNSYAEQVQRYARIAQAAGADRLNIGAEMQALDTDSRNAARWSNVIDTADANFAGKIGYTTVHWTFDSQPTRTMIYSNPKIDYISLSAYFDLATPAQAAASGAAGNMTFINQVKANFNQALQTRILQSARAIGKKVVLNEIGVTPYDGATVHPWDWEVGNTAAYDPAEARNAFEGIFRALEEQGADVTNANLWIWGWQGGFAGERFYINNNTADLPNTTFDESKMKPSIEYIQSYLRGIPEPATTTGAMLGGGVILAARRRTRE